MSERVTMFGEELEVRVTPLTEFTIPGGSRTVYAATAWDVGVTLHTSTHDRIDARAAVHRAIADLALRLPAEAWARMVAAREECSP